MTQLAQILDFSKLSQNVIQDMLQEYQLNLTVEEILTIQNTFLQRAPTLAECVLWSIQGSEHCSYKSTRKHLQQFVTTSPHVILGPKEDAGVVSVATDNQGMRYGIVVSHESHNHPSQIVPYEGAATGVGGNVRDVSCMGADVIAVADSLRFGDLSQTKTHWVQEGVVAGIAGYANPLGIPNIAGDIYYDAGYNDNCLVTIVTLGVVREDQLIHSYAPKNAKDYVYILVGKPTDNSGFGGASFASSNLEAEQQEKNKGAVQEPNAFLQRHILKANAALFKRLRAEKLIDQVGFKDLGAGGIACASVELADASDFGAEIELEHVPTSMQGLAPQVILCSETQERFMWIVPRHLADSILTHYNVTFALPDVCLGARASVIGKLRDDGQYIVRYQGQEIVNAKACDITKGILYDRPYTEKTATLEEPTLADNLNANDILLQLLAHENIASREAIFETYDKQVQGRTHIEAGCADAGVLTPFNDDSYPEEIRKTAIALSLDQNPRYNKIDAYWGAVNAVLESARNVACVGARPQALSDCLCFGNPEIAEQMGEFVSSVKGIVAATKAIIVDDETKATLPVISGNVSLYNASAKSVIPPSPMIACLGVMPNVQYALTYDFKRAESALVMIGTRLDECGGSVFYQLLNELGSQLPKPDLTKVNAEIQTVISAIQQGLVLAAHDIADGGIAVTLAEMGFKRDIGVRIDIPGELSTLKKLFSETGGFVLEVTRDKLKNVLALFLDAKVDAHVIGSTTATPRLFMQGVIDISIREAKKAWQDGLREKL